MRRATKTGNKNQRPPAHVGRALKVWMLSEFGDGITVLCSFGCGKRLFYSEITKDRYPIPGRKGGRYARGNVRPACMGCNAREGAREAALERAKAEALRQARNERRRLLYAARTKGTPMTIESDSIIETIRALVAERKQRAIQSYVFVYSPSISPTEALVSDAEVFDDGMGRVFLHPSHEETIEAWRVSI